MFKKYLIVASRSDPAGMNILNQLAQFKPRQFLDMNSQRPFFDFYIIENEIIQTENLDTEKINKYDFVIFASKHSSSSENAKRTLSIHAPGNFRDASMGGVRGKVCRASGLFNKFLYQKMDEKIKESNLREFEPTMEVTHHGPLIDKPCVFIEIGPTINEWKNSRAGFVIAKTIFDAVTEYEHNAYKEVAIGIGGPHYCPGFNKIQLKSNVAISHVIPGYVMPITEEMIKETINKTIEEYDFVIVDWKGLGTAEARDEVINILEKNYIRWKKSSDVNR